MNKKICPKCESKNWMTGLLMANPTDTRVCVIPVGHYRDAIGSSDLKAEACGDCGYTEFYLVTPQKVLLEWRKQNT